MVTSSSGPAGDPASFPRPSVVELGTLGARYLVDAATGAVGLNVVPLGTLGRLVDPRPHLEERAVQRESGHAPRGRAVSPLVQVAREGDVAAGGRVQGHSLLDSETTRNLRPLDLRVEETATGRVVVTELGTLDGLVATHRLTWRAGEEALRVATRIENRSPRPITLTLVSSVVLSDLTPFAANDAPNRLALYRLRSTWSAECRLVRDPLERLHLERPWGGGAAVSERFGQVGTMPNRQWAPFVALEDAEAGVTWGLQLAWAGSWQIEIARRDDGVNLVAGLADANFGHFWRTLAPGELLDTPEARLAAVDGDVDDCCHALVSCQGHLRPAARAAGQAGGRSPVGEAGLPSGDHGQEPGPGEDVHPSPEFELPVVANDWCSVWGRPTHETVTRMAERLSGLGVDYLVIDAGWYATASGSWFDEHGDWQPSRVSFPGGLEATAAEVRRHGIVPGLWFELETVGASSSAFHLSDRLLQAHGRPVTAGVRRFLDLRQEAVREGLVDQVVGLLRRGRFGYLKIDYNETLGVGCDGAESPGEGLRRQVEAGYELLRRLRQELPELVIENCASGGSRLEPSFMDHCDVASGSDAFEVPEVPIVAANVARLVPAGRTLVWVVPRVGDDERRLVYVLAGGFLGRPCLSGDVADLDDRSSGLLRQALELYRRAARVVALGRARRFGPDVPSYRHPQGWQAVVRTASGGQSGDDAKVLAVFHAFAPPWPATIEVPLAGPGSRGGWRVAGSLASGGHRPEFDPDTHLVRWTPDGPFSAAVALLEPEDHCD